jgi:SAM-dependent methyltransferase
VSRMRAHEFSSFGATFEFLKRHCTDFTYSEYFPGKSAMVNGIRNEDVTNQTFASNSLDLLTSNGVMEHVPEDVQGYLECHRVLKPGGMLIFTVPLYDTPESIKLASLNGKEIVWHGTPEYHDSRLGGPFTAPTFWRHSLRDMCGRVRQVGFRSVELVDVTLSKSHGEPSKVIKAVK